MRVYSCGFVPMSYFYSELGPMNDLKIEGSNRCGFGQQQLLADSVEIFISHEHMKEKVTRSCPKFTKH